MNITIHSYSGKIFEVTEWNYHHDHEDEEAGLRILEKEINKKIKVSNVPAGVLGL